MINTDISIHSSQENGASHNGPVGQGVGAEKFSASLYAADLARLDEIKAFMKSRGIRNISDSHALRWPAAPSKSAKRFLTCIIRCCWRIRGGKPPSPGMAMRRD